MTTLTTDRQESLTDLPAEKIHERIAMAKAELGDDLLILGHHYQRDEVIQYADRSGDSLELARFAATQTRPRFIVFCGVHFMAETADILTTDEQVVILPDLAAGCSMADMANIEQVSDAWDDLTAATDETCIPITYVNSAANLKAFCGQHGGVVCTSSNARGILKWAFEQGEKVFFFPDEHLGRNTAADMGIPLERMIVWDPFQDMGGNTAEAIRKARIILWKGFCSVHQNFQPNYAAFFRQKYPDINILVHPECSYEVCQAADFVGSTSYIIRMINEAQPGTKWAIGTEHHLVERLKNAYPKLEIMPLSPFACQCSTMYRIDPYHLMRSLVSLVEGKIMNQISVDNAAAELAKIALERMLSIRQ